MEAKPEMTLREMQKAIAKDHNVVFETGSAQYQTLRNWFNRSRQQFRESWNPKDHDDYLRGLMEERPEMTLNEMREAIARDHNVVFETRSQQYWNLRKWFNLYRQQVGTPSWKPTDHDVYLRRLMGARPGMTWEDLCEAITKDHGVVFETFKGYNAKAQALHLWIDTMRATTLSRQQLTDYYTDWVQEQRRAQPHLSPSGLWKQLSGTGLSINKKTCLLYTSDAADE